MLRPQLMLGATREPVPVSAGIGLRTQHHADIVTHRPNVGWLEVHSENYFADGGPALEHLERARALYPLSLHGVGLSLGSADALHEEHLRRLKRLADRMEPSLVSEHLSWGSVDGTFLNDLLPLPYTHEALTHMAARVQQVQEYLGRQILIENVSSYLQYADAEMTEPEFLVELAKTSGCGLLIDVNNIYVSARNHGCDAHRYLATIPPEFVYELHLAGHSIDRYDDREILIDTHSTHVCADVWKLYEHALRLFGARPTLIEWDANIPELAVLTAEAQRANQYLRKGTSD
jgi:uncharacterized protein (UPF0276 family)